MRAAGQRRLGFESQTQGAPDSKKVPGAAVMTLRAGEVAHNLLGKGWVVL